MHNITIKDIARIVGLSNQSVSAVLNNKTNCRVSPDNREKILQTARDLGYVRNSLARSMVQGRSNTVAVVFLEGGMLSEFNQRILCGCFDAANHQDFSLQLYNADNGFTENALYKLRENQVAGVLLQHSSFAKLQPCLEYLRNYHIACGVFNIRNESDTGFGVMFQDDRGTRQAVRHLHQLGHRRIAYVTNGRASQPYVRLREQGFITAMEELKLPCRNILHVPSTIFGRNLDMLKELIRQDRPDAPTAVVAVSDYLAQETACAAYELNIRIPGQLAIIGFGGLSAAEFSAVPLTTVVQPFYEMGLTGMNMLLQEIVDKKDFHGANKILDVTLKQGTSTAPLKPIPGK